MESIFRDLKSILTVQWICIKSIHASCVSRSNRRKFIKHQTNFRRFLFSSSDIDEFAMNDGSNKQRKKISYHIWNHTRKLVLRKIKLFTFEIMKFWTALMGHPLEPLNLCWQRPGWHAHSVFVNAARQNVISRLETLIGASLLLAGD